MGSLRDGVEEKRRVVKRSKVGSPLCSSDVIRSSVNEIACVSSVLDDKSCLAEVCYFVDNGKRKAADLEH